MLYCFIMCRIKIIFFILSYVAESSPTSRYKVYYYKYRNQNMVWNMRRICNVYTNIVNINVKNEMYLYEILLIMYKKGNCVCKGLNFLFICVVVKLFFFKFINITCVVESSFKSEQNVNYYNYRNQYMLCNVRDRPFNLKGGERGMFFCFVQKNFFGQHKS
jgi:high-affinity Fe2+/Pb2+ permease